MLQNEFARSIQEQIYTIESKFSPTSSFLTVTTFCRSGVFLQTTTEPIQKLFYMYNTKAYTKEYGYLLMQQVSSIFNNNNLISQNFNSFSDGEKTRTLRIPSCCNFHVSFCDSPVKHNVDFLRRKTTTLDQFFRERFNVE